MSLTPPMAMPRELAANAEEKVTLVGRFRAFLGLKLGLYAFLSLLYCAAYFGIQRLPWLHAHTFSLGILDKAIGFHPATIYAYQSIYLLIPIFPFLAETKEELFRFVNGLLLLCAICFLTFMIFPVAGPRPEHAPENWMMQFTFSLDKNLNAFPSLHAGLAVYTVLFGFAVARGSWGMRRLAELGAVWAGFILISTLATKQHYFVDLPPAIVLAWLAHRWAWSRG